MQLLEIAKVPTFEAYDKMTDAQLKDELARVMGTTAESILRAAVIVKMLEDRGENLTELRIGLVWYLRRIASGQLMPEIVARFAGSYSLERIARLPIRDQQKCLELNGIMVGTLEAGEIVVRHVPVMQMERWESRQAFANNHIREPAEQVAWMRAKNSEPKSDNGNKPDSLPYIISKNSLVVMRAVTLSKADLKRILSVLK